MFLTLAAPYPPRICKIIVGTKRTAVGCLRCFRAPQCLRQGRHRQARQHDALAGPTISLGGAAQVGSDQPGAVRRARRASGGRAGGARHAGRGEHVGVGRGVVRAPGNVSLIPFRQEGMGVPWLSGSKVGDIQLLS